MRSTWRLPAVLLALLLAGAALTGCGGDDDGSGGDSGWDIENGTVTAKILEEEVKGIPAQLGQWMVEIETDPKGKPAYTVKEVVAPPGNANFNLVNTQPVGHNLTLEEVGGGNVRTKTVREDSAWQRISLFEGTKYVFYCSVPGHRKAGMEGRIKVDPKLEAEDLEAY
jgi:plastocyanin